MAAWRAGRNCCDPPARVNRQRFDCGRHLDRAVSRLPAQVSAVVDRAGNVVGSGDGGDEADGRRSKFGTAVHRILAGEQRGS